MCVETGTVWMLGGAFALSWVILQKVWVCAALEHPQANAFPNKPDMVLHNCERNGCPCSC